jgi:hypothetical protein
MRRRYTMESRQVRRARMRKEATVYDEVNGNGLRRLRRLYRLNYFKPWFEDEIEAHTNGSTTLMEDD